MLLTGTPQRAGGGARTLIADGAFASTSGVSTLAANGDTSTSGCRQAPMLQIFAVTEESGASTLCRRRVQRTVTWEV